MLRGAPPRCECSVGTINPDCGHIGRVKLGNVTFTDTEGEHAERTQQRWQQLFDAATQARPLLVRYLQLRNKRSATLTRSFDLKQNALGWPSVTVLASVREWQQATGKLSLVSPLERHPRIAPMSSSRCDRHDYYTCLRLARSCQEEVPIGLCELWFTEPQGFPS
jgi:hypothetical protein